MDVYKSYGLTSLEASSLVNEEYTTGEEFTPFQDSDGNWFIPEVQVINCDNPTWTTFVSGLTEYTLGYATDPANKDVMAWQEFNLLTNEAFYPVLNLDGDYAFIFDQERNGCNNPDFLDINGPYGIDVRLFPMKIYIRPYTP